jgi:hypothetical protein
MMVIEEKGQSPTERSEACADFAIGSDATEWARFSLRLIAGSVWRKSRVERARFDFCE